MLTTLALSLGALSPQGPQFAPPVRFVADGKPVQVEAPGYAAPCWHDVDRDGTKDLVVGQFKKGLIKVYKGAGGPKLAAGRWLEVAGKPVEIPGVW